MIKKAVLVIIIVLSIYSCKKEEHLKIGFYYWRTVFSLSVEEQNTISNLKVNKLYIRYFDLDLIADSVIPVEPIQFASNFQRFEVIPVVYIKNKVFLSELHNGDELSNKTLKLIEAINKKHNITINEIQLDCDWNQSSKQKYFRFVKLMKSKSGLTISATIRLHQIKHAQRTGIPPMDYGVLMYYNMGKIAADNSNSIYDRSVALPYLSGLSAYPKRLQVALPIFSWLVHSRNNVVLNVYNKLETTDFENNAQFEVHSNMVEVKSSGLYKGIYFEANDILKEEKVRNKDLKKIIADLKNNGLTFDEVILFDLSLKNIKNLNDETFW